MTVLLESRDVSVRFASNRPPALDGISLSFHKGESVAIVGESGSGKTTLARVLLGLIKPTDGVVLFDGSPFPTSNSAWRASRRRLQMIPQHASGALNPRVSIRDHFVEVIKAHHLSSRAHAENLMTQRLAEVRLDPQILDSFPRRLSGGQQQRTVIARGLLLEPDVLICDEPTSALDALTENEIIDLLVSRAVSPSRLFFVITHDLRVAQKLSDRIIVMKSGKIVEDDAATKVLHSPAHPYTQLLVDASLGKVTPRLVRPDEHPKN